MKNALSELQALDMQGHKATPDVVLDTLDNRSSKIGLLLYAAMPCNM